jgi:hypothetical protein
MSDANNRWSNLQRNIYARYSNKALIYMVREILTTLGDGPAWLSKPVINKGSFGLKTILIISHHNIGGPHFMVAFNTLFLVGSKCIPYKISIFIFVIIS